MDGGAPGSKLASVGLSHKLNAVAMFPAPPGRRSCGVNFLADDAQRHFVQIGRQRLIEVRKLRPQNQIDEASRNTDHDGRAPLPMIPVRLQAVAPAKGDKQMARPLVGHRELHFDWRILPAEFAKPHPHPLKSCFGR